MARRRVADGARGGDGEVVLEVADAFCPWNEGRWRGTPAGTERTEAAADLRLDPTGLGSVYLGGFTLALVRRDLLNSSDI